MNMHRTEHAVITVVLEDNFKTENVLYVTVKFLFSMLVGHNAPAKLKI